jgi:hypothetical protein
VDGAWSLKHINAQWFLVLRCVDGCAMCT